MPFLVAVLVIIGFVWLARRVSTLADQVELLSRTLDYLQLEARRLKERLDQIQAGTPSAPARPPTPETIEQLLKNRAEPEAAVMPGTPPQVPEPAKPAPP